MIRAMLIELNEVMLCSSLYSENSGLFIFFTTSWSGSNGSGARSVRAFGLSTIPCVAWSLCTADGQVSGSIKSERIFVHFTPLCAALIVSPLDAPRTLIIFSLARTERRRGRNSRATFLKAKVGPYQR